MVIALDGYEANQVSRVGIGRYAFEILRHIYENYGLRITDYGLGQKHLFRIYLPNAPLADMPKETSWWQYRVVRLQKLWTFIGLPLALALDRPQARVIFSPTHYAPRFTSIPKVISIMDLSYLSYPELFRKKDLHQLTHWTQWSVGKAQRILTISEFSRNAIIERYGVAEDHVVVTYPGLTMDTEKTKSIEEIRKTYSISINYILSVGTIQPRKNYEKLIEAFSLFCLSDKHKNADVELVIVGKPGWLYEDIIAAPQKFGVAGRVKFLNFVPDSDLGALYKNALCFSLPSLYEGFGLPVLEALSQGCPVVVSNVSSLPEIAGKAGIYVDPADPTDIQKGLTQAIEERNTKKGLERKRLGFEQVKKFSWDKAAEQTLEILEKVGRENN